ncbi:MAG TPA: LLM class flavin-dependent oxidoreductase [Chloroflexia bacterium]|nr:LLM class flavin-dependent oxidoreductase [Chloroflexia bacterium]
MSQIGLGWFFPNGAEDAAHRSTFVDDCDRCLELVKGHFTSAWMADHLQFGKADILEGWTTLTYFAARHPELQFGHAVLCQSFRNPALLAKMAATFQFLSGGRLVFGLGTGWHEPEYQAYNYPFPGPGTRVEELEEVVTICKRMWAEDEVTFEGKHYAVQGAVCEPRPDAPPPIVIGGAKPRMLRLIARHADWWDVSGFGGVARARYPEIAAEMDRACSDVGRDPATLRRTFSCMCVCAETEEAVAELAKDMKPGFGLVGTPDQILEQVKPFHDLGVTHFQLAFADFPATTSLELCIAEILPRIAAL